LDGYVQASDFEFLRRRPINDESTDDDSNNSNNDPGNMIRGCCWLRLQMFVIRATESLVSDFTAVVAGMEEIRPGVEFSIKLIHPMFFTKDY